ncbi:response regulator transcription factor [Cohnella yongneupensis]|uniref:Response regulator n=1 Tax=Cohnella yongneupensis TaxID=425006 RepID=A0ABW0R062_9BACL
MYRVLIIDDEPWSREVVKSLGEWEKLNLTIAGEAEDGNTGLRLIESLNPDIVITDMRMPGLDGVGLLKAINEKFPVIKIIVISGYDDFVYLKQAVTSRATDYLLKPIDPNELNVALAKCGVELDRSRSADYARANVEYSVFEQPEQRDRYLNIRKQLRNSLLELDAEGVQECLRKLDERMLAKIAQDLILLVEEFAAENEIVLKQVWDRGGYSFDGTIDSLAYIYEEVLKDAIAFRHNRNRLDLSDVTLFIDRHFQDNITLDTVANYFHVSKEHLSRSFKAHTGRNMTDYIVQLKMNKAQEMMEGGLPIKHAAELTGYTDIAYFYRVFKKQFGITPGDWVKQREAHQNRAIKDNNILE